MKTNTLGYDGKGQIFIQENENLENIWNHMMEIQSKQKNNDFFILESFVNFEKEISSIFFLLIMNQ